MLKRLVQLVQWRWSLAIVFGAWLLALVFMMHEGWVWSGNDDLASGHFEVERTPTFIWLSLILVAYAAYFFRKRWRGYYGLVEVLVGLVGGFFAVNGLPLTRAGAWLAMLTSAYVVMRGCGNVSQAVEEEEERERRAI